MKSIAKQKKDKRHLRQRRVRSKITGTPQRPRLSIFRSAIHLYAQLIDDQSGRTLAAASSAEIKEKSGGKTGAAKAVGTLIANKAKDKKISAVVFDRGGYKYTGRVKALADAARAGGLNF